MSILGKILAILNVLAVLGALALMGMVYGKRSVWQYQVYRQELMMNGLPVDEAERDEMDRPVLDKLDTTTQQDLFRDASPSTPVATQRAEVARVQTELRGKVQNAGDKKKQLVVLSRILLPMALTFEQREGLRTYPLFLADDAAFKKLSDRLTQADQMANQKMKDGKAKTYEEGFHEALAAWFQDPPGPLAEAFLAARKADAAAPAAKVLDQALDTQLAELNKQFDQLFQSALEGTSTSSDPDKKSGTTRHKRRIIALLLFNLVNVLPDEAAGAPAPAKPANLWEDPKYKRVLKVVGVQAAAEAVNDQADLLKEITAEAETERLRERGLFALEHHKAIGLVQERASLLFMHNRLLEQKKRELTTHEENLKKRELDIKYYQEQLAAARKKTAEDLAKLRQMSEQLLKQREELRDAKVANQQLEKDIRALEGVR